MKFIRFTEDFGKYISQKDAFVGYIPPIRNEKDLFEKLITGLRFPYFGKNWDALIDMYREFDWIDNENIVIVHEGLSKLSADTLKKYVEVMLYSLDYWIHYPAPDTKVDTSNYTEWELNFDVYQPHDLLFVFSINEEEQIRTIIDECMGELYFERSLTIDEL